MSSLIASYVLAFHGCDKSVADRLVEGADFKVSSNGYDWLGPGIYFWEANPQRGLDFARQLAARKNSSIREPAVVGAVIDLGLCLNLTSQTGIQQVQNAYAQLTQMARSTGTELPKNSSDQLLRRLDYAVIQWLHRARANLEDAAIDTIRGVFVEGGSAYPTSGIYEKTHIQIAVRNPDCIQGVFRVKPRFLA